MRTIAQAIAILISCCLTQAATAAQPNILYFYVDDLGWGSIGPNGQAERAAKGLPFVRTPNLDRLAREGVNFTRGYGCHVCSPARSSQQSGFHQGHTFADRNDPDNAKKAMRADDVLMGDALLSAGYATGYWGKWGYGGSKSIQTPVIENIQTLPTSHGYQDVLAELHHVRAHTFFQPTLWRAPAGKTATGGLQLVPNSVAKYGEPSYPNTPALQSHADYPQVAYCDDAYCFAALDFVRRNATAYKETGKPFFGLLAAQIPHAPFDEITELPDWDAAYASDAWFQDLSPQSQCWAAMVTRIDAHFGNILAALEDPNGDGDTSDSVADNTLVVFQSDNGGPRGACMTELASNANLRGTKGSIWEGGIRVPLVMRWPKHIHQTSAFRSGTNSDRVVDVTDLLPTFCEIANVRVPLGIDGVSIAPTLTGEGRQTHRPFIIHEATGGQSIIAGQHKLVSTGGQRKKRMQLELYNLVSDPSESSNIATEHPELVNRLSEHLAAEHVYEPRGFSVTYHHWTGAHDDLLANAGNWSDYIYENAGIQYQLDAGSPKSNWVARIVGDGSKQAVMDRDISFLALEVAGDGTIKQTLDVGTKTLVARNGLRIGSQGLVSFSGGTISSIRECQILGGGELRGNGRLHASVNNRGTIAVDSAALEIQGDFIQSDAGVLKLKTSADGKNGTLQTSTAYLAGRLVVDVSEFSAPKQPLRLIQAAQVQDRFSEVVIIPQSKQAQFQLRYDGQGVLLSTTER